MSKRKIVVVCVAGLVLAAGIAAAAPGLAAGVLADLSALKDFKAGRQSSYDPSGGNADGRQDWPIQPGETREMAKIDGAGAITHIWVTIASDDKQHLKNLVLRMFWDGEKEPSIEAPIGDFFGIGHATYYHFSSLPIQIGTSKALNCFWRMPFSNGALVTVTNDGPVPCGAFYYYVDYQQYPKPPEDAGRFHAQYRQEYPCTSGQNYTFMEATGKGHYCGVSLSIHNRADGWWGEGDDMIYIDGEEKPTFNGTGSEDYFCGAWCYGKDFSHLYFGCPLRGEHKRDALWNVYRFHIEDPIPFTQSIKAAIEHGHANDRSDDFSSVAYWYQTEPHAAFPVLPEAAKRLPGGAIAFVEQDAVEAEAFAGAFPDQPVEVQTMGAYEDKWSDEKQLWLRPEGTATFKFSLPPVPAGDAGKYKLELWYTAAPDYGTCELWVNSESAGAWDGYNQDGVARKKLECPITVKVGSNTVELRVTGKNAASTGYLAGMDCFRATR